MKFYIRTDSRLLDIQQAFQAEFPYLKLSFYLIPHDLHSGNSHREKLAMNLQVSEIAPQFSAAWLEVDTKTSVSAFESKLRKIFGLNVQVLKKSGNGWIQTIQSDTLSLEELNRRTRELNEIIQMEDQEYDYHEQE